MNRDDEAKSAPRERGYCKQQGGRRPHHRCCGILREDLPRKNNACTAEAPQAQQSSYTGGVAILVLMASPLAPDVRNTLVLVWCGGFTHTIPGRVVVTTVHFSDAHISPPALLSDLRCCSHFQSEFSKLNRKKEMKQFEIFEKEIWMSAFSAANDDAATIAPFEELDCCFAHSCCFQHTSPSLSRRSTPYPTQKR